MIDNEYILLEQLQAIATDQRRTTIGMPAPVGNERRVLLTPEGAGMLCRHGFSVLVEKGAGHTVHYPDDRYTRYGARCVSRREALDCDMVLSLSALDVKDAMRLRRGALLLTLLQPWRQNPSSVLALCERKVTALALDNVQDSERHTPFYDILAEVDGRAAVVMASAILANGDKGKGILLGGVAGVVPCEAVIIGSGISACAAAKCAAGLGAIVRMFDDDVYRLRRATRSLGSWLIGSALQPRVLTNVLRSADIVIATPTETKVVIDREAVDAMKLGVVIVDLAGTAGDPTFPSLPLIDMAGEVPEQSGRVAFVNPGGAVARTAAMALSNTFMTLLTKMMQSGRSVNDSLRAMPGLRQAVFTFMGNITNQSVADACHTRAIDINLYLALS